MPLSIVRDDIARFAADALVCLTNSRLANDGGGASGAIFKAGGRELERAAARLAPLRVGHAKALRLPQGGTDFPSSNHLTARWVIFVNGPTYRDGSLRDKWLLRASYERALGEAARVGARSIGLPLISTGAKGFPERDSFDAAIDACQQFLRHHDVLATIVTYTRGAALIGRELDRDLGEYIDDVYVEEHETPRQRNLEARDLGFGPDAFLAPGAPAAQGGRPPSRASRAARGHGAWSAGESLPADEDLSTLLDHLDASFGEALVALIDERGLKDSEVYRRANVSKQVFNNIKNKPGYVPKKTTAIALGLALRLSPAELDSFLRRAGYALSNSNKGDVIVRYFVLRGEYDVMTINLALYTYDQALLGSR